MSKHQVLILMGVLVMLFLFLGFPSVLDKILAIIMGLSIIFIAYSLIPRVKISFDKKMSDSIGPNKDERSNGNLPFIEHKAEVSNSNPQSGANTINNSYSQ